MLKDPDAASGAVFYLMGSIGANVGTGGVFDYQRSGNFLTGFTQYPQFRDVSNFNVGLFMQQTGLFTHDQTMTIAGDFAKHFSSNYQPNQPYGLAPRTAQWITNGYNAGASGVYGKSTKY